ncbi:MAG: FtsQ-type POTRA domain-containing protein [Roseiflexus sp.]|nr:FtsQ-type POTRA domain-containing protein [Roseiflexus sp.]MCS7290310.1 FtsQ-type POTRA domain-containing protein [Roseiflexus sp.]MDW8146064.1 FtsQ-type POTRA domain-containing protein [Roseiflexaceae bacterium]MDW8231274.1 FtsQ-type POTRA domain-containing protein [Roseiflexaceae bacterium]
MQNNFQYNQPNTRARVAARRNRQRNAASAMPGPRRAIGEWLASGRIASLILFLASLGGLIAIAVSPQFVVRTVRINGIQILNAADVEEMAGVTGSSIWLVQTDEVEARVARSPYVERVEASLTLPDILTINVVERQPEMRWQVGDVRYLVDAEGRVLGPDTAAFVTDTLIIEDRSGQGVKPNDRIDPDVLSLVRALALRLPNEAGVTLSGISWDREHGVTLTTTDQRTIVFGRKDRLEEKIQILRFLTLQEPTEYTWLDLRPATPYYRNDAPPRP